MPTYPGFGNAPLQNYQQDESLELQEKALRDQKKQAEKQYQLQLASLILGGYIGLIGGGMGGGGGFIK